MVLTALLLQDLELTASATMQLLSSYDVSGRRNCLAEHITVSMHACDLFCTVRVVKQ